MLGITTNPDNYAEPPETHDAQETFERCPHRRICQMQYDRNGDAEHYAWEWCGCDECEWGAEAVETPCPHSLSGLARCGGPY